MSVSIKETVADLLATFKNTGRLVIVGASLAGLRAAEGLRKEGFTGHLTSSGMSQRSRMTAHPFRSRY